MKSYWFVHFTALFKDKHNKINLVEGNSTHVFESKSFLPGTVIKILRKRILDSARNGVQDPTIRITFFTEIDEEGVKDFDPIVRGDCSIKDGLCSHSLTISQVYLEPQPLKE